MSLYWEIKFLFFGIRLNVLSSTVKFHLMDTPVFRTVFESTDSCIKTYTYMYGTCIHSTCLWLNSTGKNTLLLMTVFTRTITVSIGRVLLYILDVCKWLIWLHKTLQKNMFCCLKGNKILDFQIGDYGLYRERMSYEPELHCILLTLFVATVL